MVEGRVNLVHESSSLSNRTKTKNYYSECCDIKSTIKYNDKAATESLNIIKNIFGVK